jgi:hypothetical protein
MKRYCHWKFDEKSWSKEYGVAKRPFTIDTWDFVYDTDTSNRSIEETTRMPIMHGDNSGVDQLEGQRLSLSNTYAINRGVTNLEESGSFAQKASIEIILA